MKISKLFHTLYAFLMFLPVMVLPLFAININQKEVELLTAQIENADVIDFNQLIKNGNFEDDTYYSVSNGTISVSNNELNITNINTGSILQVYVNQYFTCNYGDKLYVKYSYNCNELNNFSGTAPTIVYDQSTYISFTFNTNSNGSYSSIFTFNLDNSHTFSFLLSFNNFNSLNLSGSVLSISNLQFFNLTTMFGSGNEPTIEQFNTWFPNDYYEYTLSEKQILYTGTDTLNNTDIGSQFLYSLYNPLKDYFNLPNYMNLGGLYDWFLLNLFSGYNSPVYFIIFDLMIYWLAMSVLWLIFDVLMYVPSMIHKMLDKARME